MARAATVLVARAELRRRWPGLVAVAVVAGLAGAATAGLLSATRRTLTASARLEAAVHAEDIRVSTFVGTTDAVVALPGVARSWRAGVGVGRLTGGPELAYLGVLAGPSRPADLFTPVVLEGRAADPTRADEVVVAEAAARRGDVHPGTVLDLAMLAPEQLGDFDQGPIEPTGPRLRLTVTGIVRLTPLPANENLPVLATPALFTAHPEAFALGSVAYVDLVDGGRGVAAFRAEVAALAPAPTPGVDVPPVQVSVPDDARAPVSASLRILGAGLWGTVALVGAAGIVAVAQAVGRQAAASAGERRVEAALGLTPHEQALARVLACGPAAAVAAVATAAGALVGGLVPALGPARHLEPHPGWAPNWGLAIVGGTVAALVVTGVTYGAARLGAPSAAGPPAVRRGRRVTDGGGRRIRVALGARSVGVSGTRGGGLAAPSLVAAAVVAVTGVVAAGAVAASVDRLADEPGRWGWDATLAVLDATDATVATLAADPDVTAVARLRYTQIGLAGAPVEAYAFEPVDGTISWTILAGRAPADGPAGDGEVVLGPRLASRLDRRLGDDVVIGDRTLRVVGIGLGPIRQNERLGSSLLVSTETLLGLAVGEPTGDAMVRTAPGTVDAVRTRLLGSELDAPSPPDDVEHVAALGRLPETVAAVLAVLFLAVLAHALASAGRRRAADVAVLRAVGYTSGQVAGSVLTSAVTVATVGVLAGVPLGLGTARLLWWALAHDSGVATDLAVPWAAVGAIVAGTLVAGLAVAVRPARRATHLDLAALLRTE